MKMFKFPKVFGKKKAKIAELELKVAALEAELKYRKGSKSRYGKAAAGKKVTMKVQPTKTK